MEKQRPPSAWAGCLVSAIAIVGGCIAGLLSVAHSSWDRFWPWDEFILWSLSIIFGLWGVFRAFFFSRRELGIKLAILRTVSVLLICSHLISLLFFFLCYAFFISAYMESHLHN
jgi:hypothetical protein